ncbi:hypothetical protein PM082_011086 [Marasmius tenuissimus]|nr:hypothetical protein PM082_011086 [Marasmius tenuissimus]
MPTWVFETRVLLFTRFPGTRCPPRLRSTFLVATSIRVSACSQTGLMSRLFSVEIGVGLDLMMMVSS